MTRSGPACFDFWLDFEFCTEEELSHSGVAEEYRRFCYRFREEYIYEMLRLSRESHPSAPWSTSPASTMCPCGWPGLLRLRRTHRPGADLRSRPGPRPGPHPLWPCGGAVLNQILPGGFRHNEQSLRVVDRLEKGGEGLNLCYEVRRGILCHTGHDRAETLEGQIVRLADKIAYINTT